MKDPACEITKSEDKRSGMTDYCIRFEYPNYFIRVFKGPDQRENELLVETAIQKLKLKAIEAIVKAELV